ncbi:MAG: hypothetical protein ACE5R3_07005, partial [Nitrosopumilaceae archaeon]
IGDEAEEISVTISVDKSSYLFGETATLSGSVSKQVFVEKPTFSQAPIDVVITGHNYYNDITLYPDLNLEYKLPLKLQKVLGILGGDYVVSVSYAGTTSQTEFFVGDEVIETTTKGTGDLVISTDKESYIPGQTAIIFAKSSEIIEFEGLKFTVTNPNNVQVFEGTLFPNLGKVSTALRPGDLSEFADSQFITNIFMDTVSPVYGIYTITAQYGDQTATSTFEVSKDIKEEKRISLKTDKPAYGLGETVKISGRLNNLYVPTMDLEVVQTRTIALDFDPSKLTKELTSVRLSGDSTFSYEFKIPNNSNSLGGFRVTVSQDVGTATTSFLVMENPEEYVADDESLFTVTTSKTIYDVGDELVISGRATEVKTSSSFQSSVVNIKITKADGSSIIIGTYKPSSSEPKTATFSLTAVPDIIGTYKVKQSISKNIFPPGTYNIKATYAEGQFSDSTTFTVVDPQDISGKFLLQLNKQVFGFNEEVLLDGIVPGIAQGTGIDIKLIKPDGDTDKFGKLADDSRFSWSWTTPRAEKPASTGTERSLSYSNYGVYQIIVSTDSGGESIFFKVSPNPEQDSLVLMPLEVTTDKAVYAAGETLRISGFAIKRQQGQEGLVVQDRAEIIVKTTTFPVQKIYSSNVYLDAGGHFKSSFTLPVTIFKEGIYKVEALYQKNKAESLFSINNEFNIGGDVPLAILLDTDKEEYGLGETVKISGRPTKIVYLDNLSVTIVREDQTQITCGSFICGKAGETTALRPSASGSLVFDYVIPTKDSALGIYEVIVDSAFGTFST